MHMYIYTCIFVHRKIPALQMSLISTPNTYVDIFTRMHTYIHVHICI